MKHIGLLLLFVSILTAGQVAVLEDGSRIIVNNHENNGEMIRLQTPDGEEDVLADEIEKFEDIAVLEEPPVLPPSEIGWESPISGLAKLGNRPFDHNELIRTASQKYRVPETMVRSIMAAESAFNPNAISPKGAVGLMQVMPSTAKEMGYDPHVPQENVNAGARYLRMLLDKYENTRDWLRRVIAAYNAGPGAVDKYRGVPPYKETRTYVSRVLSYMKYYTQ